MPTAPALHSRYAVLLSREIGGEVYFREIRGHTVPLSGTDPDPAESARWKAARSKHIEQAMKDRGAKTVHVATKEGDHVISAAQNRVHATDPTGKTQTTFHDNDRAARSAAAARVAHVEHDAHARGDTPHTQSAVAIDDETAAAVKHGKLTVPTEGGEVDPHLVDAYKRHAQKLGCSVGEFKYDKSTNTATATLTKGSGTSGKAPEDGGAAPAAPAKPAASSAPEVKSKAGAEAKPAADPSEAERASRYLGKYRDSIEHHFKVQSPRGEVSIFSSPTRAEFDQHELDREAAFKQVAREHGYEMGDFQPDPRAALPENRSKTFFATAKLVKKGGKGDGSAGPTAPAPRPYVAPPEVKAVQGVRRAIETSGNAAHIEAETANGTRVRVQGMAFGRITPDGLEAVTPDGSTLPLSSVRRLHVDGKVAWEHSGAKAAPVATSKAPGGEPEADRLKREALVSQAAAKGKGAKLTDREQWAVTETNWRRQAAAASTPKLKEAMRDTEADYANGDKPTRGLQVRVLRHELEKRGVKVVRAAPVLLSRFAKALSATA